MIIDWSNIYQSNQRQYYGGFSDLAFNSLAGVVAGVTAETWATLIRLNGTVERIKLLSADRYISIGEIF